MPLSTTYTKVETDYKLQELQHQLANRIKADEEDLTQNGSVLKFADKTYNSANNSGYGRKYIRKGTLTTSDFIANTIHIIQYAHDLSGVSITLPENCILEFKGGILFNGILIGNNTKVVNEYNKKIFDLTLSGSWSVNITPEMFGAIGNNLNDDTLAIQKAIDFANLNTKALVYFSSGVYRITNTIYIPSNIGLLGNRTTIDCTDIDNIAFEIVGEQNKDGEIVKIMDGFYIYASNGYNNTSFKSGSICFNHKAHEISFQNVFVRGFEFGNQYQSNSYIIWFINSSFRWNKYAVYFDYTSDKTNLGEQISFVSCTFGNNQVAIYNNQGEIFLTNCSLDFNDIQISKNSFSSGGVYSSHMVLTNCHIEFSNTQMGIINEGIMRIIGGMIWSGEEYERTTHCIDNTNLGKLTLSNVTTRMIDFPYMVIGNKPTIEGRVIGRQDNMQPMIHPQCSNIWNSDFERSDNSLSGYTLVSGTMEVSTTKAHSGTKSLKLTGEMYKDGTVSYIVKPKGRFFKAVAYCNNYGNDGRAYLIVDAYDKNNVLLTNSYTSFKCAFDAFDKAYLDEIEIMPHTEYLKITLRVGDIGETKVAYFDDLYMTFFE